jgi:hypothetical protein
MEPLDIEAYPVLEVSTLRRAGDEPMGTKRKFWSREQDGRRYLFKYAREGTGEDWSEKIAAEVAAALGVPHAEVDLAVCGGEPGTLTLDFTDEHHALIHGNELLQEHRPEYPVHVAYGASEHTIAIVLDALGRDFVHPPATTASAVLATAADWFLGYLMLDAFIGNTDRHHENWAVLERADRAGRHASLAPSYDHASSLGREGTLRALPKPRGLQAAESDRSLRRGEAARAQRRSALARAPPRGGR